MTGTILSPALALLLGLTVPELGEAKALHRDHHFLRGEVRQFGDWLAGCSNQRTCIAIVPIGDDDGTTRRTYVQLTFAGNSPDATGFAVMRSGAPLATYSQAAAARFSRDLRSEGGADSVRIVASNQEYAVPRKGFADLARALAQWWSRLPLVATGHDTVIALPAVRLDNPIPPLKVAGAARKCPVAVFGQSLQAWRGIDGSILWRVGCGSEGLNPASFWYMAGPQGAPAIEVRFEGRDDPVPLSNSWFSAETGYLHSTHYFGYFESFTDDCGIYRAYAWGIAGIRLAEQREMPLCGTGIGPEGWIPTYRATVPAGTEVRP